MKKTKKSLVIVAHGSRRTESNEEVEIIAKKLSGLVAFGFSDIRYGFLELAEPSIPDAIIQSIEAGADTVIILPYFLSAGRHVTVDIPNEVQKVQDQYPDLTLIISPYLGSADGLLEVISKIALSAESG